MGHIMDLRRIVGHIPLFMPGAGVFFVDGQNRALLQRRRDNGLWAGTGGSMEPGETFEETVCREAREEVGLTPLSLERLGVYSGEAQHYIYPNGDEVYVVATAYVCTRYEGQLRVDPEECLEARFFALSEFPEEDCTHPNDRPMIRDLKNWMVTNAPPPGAPARPINATRGEET